MHHFFNSIVCSIKHVWLLLKNFLSKRNQFFFGWIVFIQIYIYFFSKQYKKYFRTSIRNVFLWIVKPVKWSSSMHITPFWSYPLWYACIYVVISFWKHFQNGLHHQKNTDNFVSFSYWRLYQVMDVSWGHLENLAK